MGKESEPFFPRWPSIEEVQQLDVKAAKKSLKQLDKEILKHDDLYFNKQVQILFYDCLQMILV